MKSSISITLIICGTLLVLTPFLTNLVLMQVIASVMKSISRDTNLSSDLPKHMQWIACIAGLLMIVMGTRGALKSKTTT